MWVRPVVIGLLIVSATVFAGVVALGTNTSADGPRGSAAPMLAPIPTLLPPFPLCFDDAYEDNDSWGSASPVSLPFAEADLRACPDDSDWFSFPVSAGSHILVDAVFSHAGGNVDMFLTRPDGQLISSATTGTDNESISNTATVSGEYAVHVRLAGDPPDVGNPYKLHISTFCPDDAFEDNDSQATAFPASLPFSEAELRACPNDSDWFSFPVSAGTRIVVDAVFSHADGNVDMLLKRPDGLVASYATTSTDNEGISYTAPVAGEYAVLVELAGDTPPGGNAYELHISTPCPDDAFEDNDSQATAFPVTLPFTQSALRVCPRDRDWFSFHLDAGDDVLPYISFVNDTGDLDIYLHDPSGEIVSASESSFRDHESTPHTAEVSGVHAVEVVLFADTPVEGNSYTLEISILADPTPTETPASTPSPTPTEAAPPIATATPTISAGLPGDVDCSGAVDSLDALFLLQFAAGLLDSFPCPENADVNEDGSFNAVDAQLILQYGAGLIPSLPP